MRDAILRPATKRDIDAIAGYTSEHWGMALTRAYVAGIRYATEQLSTCGMGHTSANYAYAGLRRMTCVSYFI